MRLKPIGLIFVIASLAAPLIWLPPLIQQHDVSAIFSQYLGIFALIAMALTQIIATRFKLIETIFGGLDRSYILHKWLGIGALIAILLHDTIDADIDGVGLETALTDIAETAGEISLYGILILIILSIATFIPYHLWHWTHRFMGLFFAMGAFHYLFILKPFTNADPLGLYTASFCLFGVLAYFYKLLPTRFTSRFDYQISDIQKSGNAISVVMRPSSPKGRIFKHRSGQFAFVTFEEDLSTEPHPFTISKANDEKGVIRMTIANLGDYTHTLHNAFKAGTLGVGMNAKIEGPFGRFERHASKQSEIWIAAGIGITPFIAWAQSLGNDTTPITLFYSFTEEVDAAHLDELQAIAEKSPNLKLHLNHSKTLGRLTADKIANKIDNIKNSKIYFCGPQEMRKSLQAGFIKIGLKASRFHFEEFELRSGIGLKKLAQLALEKTTKNKS